MFNRVVGLDKETEASQIVGRIRNLTVVNGNTVNKTCI
jgi:hypothetical protein